MTLDELLLEWSYRSKKGYPCLDSPSDISLLKQLLEELNLPTDDLLNNLGNNQETPSYTPKHKKANTRKAIDLIMKSKYCTDGSCEIGTDPNYFKKMSDAYRIGNLDNIDKDEFMEILIDLFDNPKIKITPPKTGTNTSSKYNVFEFEWEGEGPVEIILAGGANKGEKYEQDLLNKMQESFGLPMDDIKYEDVKEIIKRLNINPEDYNQDDVFFAGASDTKRQPSFDGPIDLGSKVADIVINTKDKPTYLSIKNEKGSAIYNGGNVDFVRMEGEKAIFDQSKYNDKPLVREIFEICGIDPQRMADGINDYITQQGKRGEWEVSTSVDLGKVKELLASSFGYGYWYIREKAGKTIPFIHYIKDADGAYDMIGELNADAVKIKYPGTTSKNLDVSIETDSPIFKQEEGRVPLRYEIVIRNASGKILPARLNIKTSK